MDEIGPVPPALLAGVPESDVNNVTEWLNNLIAITQRSQTTENEGRSLKMPFQADSTATTLAEMVTDHNALLAKLQAAGKMEDS